MKRATKAIPIPASHLDLMRDMNLTAISYLNASRDVRSGAKYRREWLPRDVVANDGLSLLVHRGAGDLHNGYSFAGWDCWHDGIFGGMREDILSALAWIQRARDVRSGAARDFLGV
jgi:hypothetical protein